MIHKILEDEEIDKSMTEPLESLDYSGLIRIASKYSDAVIRPKDDLSKKVESVLSTVSPKKKIYTINLKDIKLKKNYLHVSDFSCEDIL